MNLTINKLPTKTWNHLNMNEINVNLDGEFINHTPSAELKNADVIYKENYEAPFFKGLKGELEDFTVNAKTCFIESKTDLDVKEPIVLNFNYKENEHAISKIIIHANQNSELNVVMTFKSNGDFDVSAVQTYVYADKDAKVNLYLAQLLSENSICLNNITGLCSDKATISLTKLELGAAKAYSDVEIELKGDESQFNTEIGYHAAENQTVDMNYATYHYGKNTECLMEVNGTLEENSKKMFRGTIDFKQGCKGSKGTENENVLLLGEEMSNGTIPLILCAEEDVEGNHGASIGKLDEKVLFYLGSRGISEKEAQNIIAMSRIDNICNKFPIKEIQDDIRKFERNRGITHESKL